MGGGGVIDKPEVVHTFELTVGDSYMFQYGWATQESNLMQDFGSLEPTHYFEGQYKLNSVHTEIDGTSILTNVSFTNNESPWNALYLGDYTSYYIGRYDTKAYVFIEKGSPYQNNFILISNADVGKTIDIWLATTPPLGLRLTRLTAAFTKRWRNALQRPIDKAKSLGHGYVPNPKLFRRGDCFLPARPIGFTQYRSDRPDSLSLRPASCQSCDTHPLRGFKHFRSTLCIRFLQSYRDLRGRLFSHHETSARRFTFRGCAQLVSFGGYYV